MIYASFAVAKGNFTMTKPLCCGKGKLRCGKPLRRDKATLRRNEEVRHCEGRIRRNEAQASTNKGHWSATAKEEFCCSEGDDENKMKPQVRRSEATLRHSEESIDHMKTSGFVTTKRPSLQRRTTGWSSKLQFLSPSLAHFPKHINRCSLDILRVWNFREEVVL